MIARLRADQGHNAAERKVGFKDAFRVMKDYRVWLGGFMYFGLIVPVSRSWSCEAPGIDANVFRLMATHSLHPKSSKRESRPGVSRLENKIRY